MADQLILDMRLPDSASFGNFVAEGNMELVALLQKLNFSTPSDNVTASIYLYGPSGAGKTHLLQSLVRAIGDAESAAVYCNAQEIDTSDKSLHRFLRRHIVCIDDLHTLLGQKDRETFLFALYEQLREKGGRLVVAAAQPLDGLTFALADLKSRLRAGLVYRINPLTDALKAQAVRLRARNRGFDIADDVVQYVLQRYPRDTKSLFSLLDHIDALSLQKQRRVTIPFLRELDESLRRG